jgi:addiction module RelE/StbE family toxin
MASKIKKVVFDASFERKFTAYKKRLSKKELKKLKERIIIFKNNPFDPRLKTHKLKGRLKDYWVFAISYSDRIIFRFLEKERVFFIDIGDHSIYK